MEEEYTMPEEGAVNESDGAYETSDLDAMEEN
jgi:hypothetical protein